MVVLATLAIVAIRDVARLDQAQPWREMYDFGDFYCAGEALDRHRDPYRYEPLHACEHRVNRSAVFAGNPSLVIPAPQPPYDFPPFMALARLDYGRARVLYALGIGLALVLAVAALSRLEIPLDVAALALLLPAGYIELRAGQIVPFALAALTLCGACLAVRRDVFAGIFSALTLVEPHLGLPVVVATFVFARSSRLAVTVTAAVLAATGVVTVGVARVIEYGVAVLPAQAASEVNFPYEYSLTYALARLGAPAGIALAAGAFSYVLLVAFGLVATPRLAQSLQRRELLAFFPAATGVMAGAYAHMVGLCFAIPAALVFAVRLRGWARNCSAVALCGLVVPWIAVWAIKKLFALSILVCALLLLRLQIAPGIAVGVVGALTLTIYGFELYPPVLAQTAYRAQLASDALAQTPWRAFVDRLGTANAGWFAIKLPTWTSLALLLVASLHPLRSPGASATSRESSRETPCPEPASRRARRD